MTYLVCRRGTLIDRSDSTPATGGSWNAVARTDDFRTRRCGCNYSRLLTVPWMHFWTVEGLLLEVAD